MTMLITWILWKSTGINKHHLQVYKMQGVNICVALLLLLQPCISMIPTLPPAPAKGMKKNFSLFNKTFFNAYLFYKECWNVCWGGVFLWITRSWSLLPHMIQHMLISTWRSLTSSPSMTRSSPSACPCTSLWCGRKAGYGQTTQWSRVCGILYLWSFSMIYGFQMFLFTTSRASQVCKFSKDWQVTK